jgi:protein SCO1/2
MSARLLRIGVIAIVAFALGLFLARALFPPRSAVPATELATILPTPRGLPALALVGADTRPLGSEFFRGRWTLVFFGFTQCPDLCPTTLGLLAQATRQLTDLPAAEQPRVLFVSLDPQRDTPQLVGDYVRFFDARFVGATGTPQAVADAATAFAVPFAKVSLPDGGYTIDHGSGVFIVGPSGGIEAFTSGLHDAGALARDFRKTMRYVEQRR